MKIKQTVILLGLLILTTISASAASKKQKTIRVACIGNSITYGTGIADRTNDSYPSQLQRLLGSNYQ